VPYKVGNTNTRYIEEESEGSEVDLLRRADDAAREIGQEGAQTAQTGGVSGTCPFLPICMCTDRGDG